MVNQLLMKTTVLLLLSSGAAFAADASAPADTGFDWTGVYAGVNVGGGFGTFDHPFSAGTTLPPATLLDGSLDISAGGFLGGAQAGYNWQSGQMVFGVETDIQGSAVKAENALNLNIGGPGGIDVNGEAGTKVDWFGTLRARMGFTPTDRLMVYGTAGVAYGRVKSYIDGDISVLGALAGSIDESSAKTKAGWTAGAGAEYAVTNNWTIKSEYLYTDFGKSTLYSGDLGTGLPINATLKNDVSFHTIRIGLNYRF